MELEENEAIASDKTTHQSTSGCVSEVSKGESCENDIYDTSSERLWATLAVSGVGIKIFSVRN